MTNKVVTALANGKNDQGLITRSPITSMSKRKIIEMVTSEIGSNAKIHVLIV